MGHQPVVRIHTDQIDLHHVLRHVVLHTVLHLPLNHDGVVLSFAGRRGEDGVHFLHALHDCAAFANDILYIEFQVDVRLVHEQIQGNEKWGGDQDRERTLKSWYYFDENV